MLHHKTVHPKQEFYDLYNKTQILDIINSLSIRGEIPRQYGYLGKGARMWEEWTHYMSRQTVTNNLTGAIELIHTNMDKIDDLLKGRRVNIIDLGIGTAHPIKELLGHLLDRGSLNRYIAIDISPSMISIAKNNIESWFDGKVPFEGYVRDMTKETFDDLLVDDMLSKNSTQIINLILILGATPTNFYSFGDAFRTVYKSVSPDDILLYTDSVYTKNHRQHFDFDRRVIGSSIQPKANKLQPVHRYAVDLLDIDESFYEVEVGFDPIQRHKYVRIRLTRSITIEFEIDKHRRAVNLEKGDAILLLRVWNKTSQEIITEFEELGFTLLHSSLTQDRRFFMSISGIETKRQGTLYP